MAQFKLFFMNRTDPEYKKAWAQLGPDPKQESDDGEVWQYMGTEEVAGGWFRPAYEHVFRHRSYPSAGLRNYRRFKASRGWRPKEENAPLKR